MSLDLQYKIYSNPNYVHFLETHSYWYKYLNRSSKYFKDFVEEMKDTYHIRVSDRMEKMKEKIEMVSQLMDILNT